ncbi:MAG: DUF4238 domain-containing protein [Pseudomonadota bacterium]
MSKPRKHHYIQAAHLEGFVEDSKSLFLYSKDGLSFWAGISDAFSERDLYSFGLNGDLAPEFEVEFNGKVESHLFPSLRATNAAKEILPSHLPNLVEYIAFSHIRSPTFRDLIIEYLRLKVKSQIKIMDNSGDLPKPPPEIDSSISELINEGQISIEICNSKFLEFMCNEVNNFFNILYRKFNWQLVVSDRHQFIIGDQPVTIIHPGRDYRGYGIPPGGDGCEVAFPLSSECCMLGTWGKHYGNICDRGSVDELNKRQALFARRFVATGIESKGVERLVRRYKNWAYASMVDNIEHDDGGLQLLRLGIYPRLTSKYKKTPKNPTVLSSSAIPKALRKKRQ